MIRSLVICLVALASAALVALRVREVRRSLDRGEDPEEEVCHGMLLSRSASPLAAALGRPAYHVEVLSDGGDKMTLEVRSLPLFSALATGVSGTIRRRGGVLLEFQPDAPGTERDVDVKEQISMKEKKLLKNGALWGVGIRDILVEGDRILAVGEGLTAEAEVIDLSGKTVLPGFFNAHVHLYGVEGPLPDELIRSFVTGGCTTVRDMGMTSELDFGVYMEWLSTRKGPEFPEILTAGKFLAGENTYGAIHPSGAKVGYIIQETPEGAARAVDAMVDAGADLVKTGQDYGMDPSQPLDYFSQEVFQAICRRAKERGVPSAAHITKRDNFVDAAHWGLTECAHTPTNELTDEDIDEVVRSGMAFNTTASIFDMVSAQTGEQIMDAVISNLGRLYRAGVPMSVGTDYMHEGAPYQTAGIPVYELQLLVRSGLTAEEAIQAATIGTAKVIGVEDRLGSVEPGKQADIIAVDAPIDDTFEALKPERVVFVMHRGAVIK